MKKLFVASLLLIAFAHPALAKTPAEIIASTAKIFVNRDSIDNNRKASGFFVDPSGCLLTDAHVILNGETGQPFDDIQIGYPRDYKKAPEIIGTAHAVYFDRSIDFAVLCVDKTAEFFPSLDIATASEVAALDFGDKLRIVGFPVAGSDTVTYSQSNIIGFWNEPDLKSINGTDHIDATRIKLVKTDGISGIGGSGSPIINAADHVVAIMFAGQNFSAVPGLSIIADVWRDEVHLTGAPASDCLYDPVFDLYVKGGNKFYDNQCHNKQDRNLESVVSANFTARCPGVLESWKLKSAVQHIENGSSIDEWFKYLVKVCPVPVAPIKVMPAKPALTKTVKNAKIIRK